METRDFLIRKTEFADYEFFVKWENDPVVTKYLTFDECRSYEDVVSEAMYNNFRKDKMDFTIVERQKNTPVGRIFISEIDEQSDCLDINKFYIGEKELWGKGIATKILRELLEYCFTFLHMERVSIDYYSGNTVAYSLYKSLGFKEEGVARHAAKKNGKYYDLHLMSILRSEFFEESQ